MEAGKWSSGRPVFKKVDGEQRFLYVKEGTSYWSIRDSLNITTSLSMKSGRATNSPTSPEAGPSDRYGVTRWRFWNGANWVEADISLKCKLDGENEYGDNVT